MNEGMPIYCAHLSEDSLVWHSVTIHGKNYRLCDDCFEQLRDVIQERGLTE